jgi:hypothetical protein
MGKYTASVHDHLLLSARVLLTRGHEHAFRLSGQAVPAPVPVRLLIDTGSRRSTLLPSVIAHLNPDAQGVARLETSLGAAEVTLYWVRLEFPETALAAIPEVAVARAPLPPSLQAFYGVIGRDLLRRWESFLYQGRRGRLVLRDAPAGLFGWLFR